MSSKSETKKNLTTPLIDEYDDLPYPSYPYSDTHPNKLSSMGILFGMQPTPIDDCKVLELGCGSGSNLIGMAAGLPNSEFTGIDLSGKEIKLAKQKAGAINLSNIQLEQQNILDFDDTNKFDYIICHGVYSWVPHEVREKILSICSKNLSDNGIAYISYNTYPAWHAHEMVRDMMMFHIRNIEDKHEAIKSARDLLNSITKIARPNSPFHSFMRFEVERMMKFSDPYFYHDQLSKVNQPFDFYKFANDVQAHKLQYLCETDLPSTLPSNFSKKTMDLIENYSDDVISTEQYLDYIMNRAFRRTLICHDNIQLNRSLDPAKIKNFYFTSTFRPEMVENDRSKDMAFKSHTNSHLVAKDPLSISVWLFMREQYPKPINLETIKTGLMAQLKQHSKKDISAEEIETHILGNLLLGYSIGGVEFYTEPPLVCKDISARPEATPLARHEANSQLWVTSQLHSVVHIDSIHRYIIPMLNGKNTKQAIIEELLQLAKQGKLTVKAHKQKLTDREIKTILDNQLNTILKNLARQSVLIK